MSVLLKNPQEIAVAVANWLPSTLFLINGKYMLENKTVELPLKAVKRPRKASKKATFNDEHNWDQRLGFLMHDVSRLRRIVFDNFMKPLGVTRSQWWVLAYLSRHDGMIQSDLAALLELGKAALGGLIDRLEESGSIERRADATDRRVKRVYLTTSGNQTVKEMRELSHDMSEQILKGLDHEQRLQLAEMLNLVKQNLLAIKRESGIEE
jgi:MarR family transcriptional regulator for hemolysin